MGCVPSKIIYNKLDFSRESSKFHLNPTEGIYYHNEKDPYTKSRALEAIKKNDLLLFQQVLIQFSIKPTELLSSHEHRKGLLHVLAEYNFAEGMGLVLEHITKIYTEEVSHIINSRDGLGDTCLNICCIHEATQTLEILLRSDYADPSIKNYSGKNALDIALEKESPCAKLLSLYMTTPRKAKNISSLGISTMSPLISQGSTQAGSAATRKDNEYNIENTESPLTVLDTDKEFPYNDFFLVKLDQMKLKTQSRLFNLLQSLRDKETYFIDEEFPHENHSIVSSGQFLEYFDGNAAFHWQRPEDFLPKLNGNIRLFDKVEVNDISKSPIAGCDIYSVLSTMTEYPQRLLRVFTTNEINKYGAYSVTFHVNGTPLEIVMDDHFPCLKVESQELAFSQPKDNELWFLFLEKAMAKLYGSFTDIDGINVADGFELITGMPSTQFNLKKLAENEVFDLLSDFDQRNYMISVGSHPMPGLTKNRHFTVVGVSEASDQKMIKLRSQYGDDGWRWKFTEKTKKWTKDFKEKIKYFENEKDCYYLEVKELIEQFDFVTVCFYHDNWEKKKINVNSNYKEEIFFELIVEKNTEVIISLHQALPCFVHDSPEYGISPVELMVAQDNGYNLRLIGCSGDETFLGKPTSHASDKVRMSLEEGKYIVRSQVHWIDRLNHEFTLSTMSSNPVEIKQIDYHDSKEFLEKVCIEIAMKSNRQFRFSNDCFFASGWTGPYLWIYGANYGEKNWNLNIVFEKMENLKIKKKYTGIINNENSNEENETTLRMKIVAQEKDLAIVKRLTSEDVTLKWRFEQTWEECESIESDQ